MPIERDELREVLIDAINGPFLQYLREHYGTPTFSQWLGQQQLTTEREKRLQAERTLAEVKARQGS